MAKIKTTLIIALVAAVGVAAVSSQPAKPVAEISMKISGPGAVNDSTIKAGEPVSIDIYWMNTKEQRGFTTGFRLFSPDIEKVVYINDTLTCLNKAAANIKGHNGWQDKSIWDFGGVWVAVKDWDGNLPDTIGFGGAVVKQKYLAHPNQKVLSWDMVVPTPGTISVDSAFYPPGGKWKFGSGDIPGWNGPYTFKVIK